MFVVVIGNGGKCKLEGCDGSESLVVGKCYGVARVLWSLCWVMKVCLWNVNEGSRGFLMAIDIEYDNGVIMGWGCVSGEKREPKMVCVRVGLGFFFLSSHFQPRAA